VVLGPIADQVAGEIRAAAASRPQPPARPAASAAPVLAAPAAPALAASPEHQARAQALLAALGGPANLQALDPCSSRLRLLLRDPDLVDQPALQTLAPRGSVRPSPNVLHLILGPEAQAVGIAVRGLLSD
jgi:PTS system N-acetylglucosamine-specific IIC component